MSPSDGTALLLTVVCLAFAPAAAAQLKPPAGLTVSSAALGAGTAAAEPFAAAPAEDSGPAPRVTPEQLRLRNAAVIAGGVLLVGAYGAAKWWDDGFTGDFRTANEGWFGQNTESGGADKLGHAFSAYVGTRVVTRAFEALGNEPAPAQRLAAWSTLAVMLGIEVLDGYSKRYSFSWQDAAMNVVGVGLGYLMERNRDVDNLLDFRLLYKKSEWQQLRSRGRLFRADLSPRRQGERRAGLAGQQRAALLRARCRLRHAGLRKSARRRARA